MVITEDGTEADDLAVILLLVGELDGEEVTHRFVLPAESWEGLHTVGVRAILNHETDGASEAAVAAQAELDATADDVDEYDEDPWLPFTAALSGVLEVLEPDQYLILEAAGNRFVQIAIQDGEARVETVSNQFLPEADRLPYDDLDQLAELGWEPPTHFPEDDASRGEGSPNHFVDLPPGTDPVGVACLGTPPRGARRDRARRAQVPVVQRRERHPPAHARIPRS